MILYEHVGTNRLIIIIDSHKIQPGKKIYILLEILVDQFIFIIHAVCHEHKKHNSCLRCTTLELVVCWWCTILDTRTQLRGTRL